MTSTKNTFSAKCPYCAKEEEYERGLMNGARPCPYCKKIFILVENQGDTHWEVKIKELENQLIHYQQHNKNLQFQVGLEQMLKKQEERQKQNLEGKLQEKDKDISYLKDHNQNLLVQLNESKDKKHRDQKLEQANHDLIKKLSEKDEENCRLKAHNQSLLTQIKKIKSDKKTVQDKLEQLINKESLVDKETMTEPMELQKSSNGKNLMVDKAINTDPVNLTTQRDSVDVKRSSHVEVETSQGYEEDSIPSVNQEEATSTQSKDQVARMPYRHPNHKNRYFNQSMYPQKQMTNMSKIITSITNDAQGRSYHGSQNTSNCLQEPHKSPIVQKIDLRWADSLTIRQFYTTLRRSYRFKSSTITNSRMNNQETILQARARDKSSISML
jgi:hypothetical protein